MPMKRATDLGFFRAVARSARTGVLGEEGGLAFVEVDVEVLASSSSSLGLKSEDLPSFWFVGKRINWRGGFSAAAIHRTLRTLLAMGATFPKDDPTNLDGVGSREFRVRVVSVDCSDEETHGVSDVKRFFVHEVLP